MFFEAFHDCVGPDGCDGCLNLNTPDNAGLGEIRDILVLERQQRFKVSIFIGFFTVCIQGKCIARQWQLIR